ncbi:squalene-associated FAD-dependent desaturase [Sphaerotilus natans subsp. natans DSM 6575]|uniref:Squalene-associated FAD-dependent desaturase n=1 Tax=Sphaerotilus natans subsp. natans DSM 6575 TaxID=1286631 RepID=A0A059KS53_9BURK|nr:hydroxysqualene dehydroxylase HpnE [Sphaerotilus natans]KDB54019.1 squalene-associated FAD-dependent desaturase [Sphaerotilus natans subsp. natans DSM 6575]SIS05857.1 squalene-associated FAD-dependent desaturase [Sphaerotilus natans]
MRRVAIVGAGWAGLAAAVRAVEAGHAVIVLEMAPQPGGRARSLAADGADSGSDPADRLDNGQHILIGAYTATLDLMRRVGVDPDAVLRRQPLALLDQDGRGLKMRPGPALIEFGRAVWTMRHWRLSERLALSTAALGWLLRRFRCDEQLTVAQLTAGLPARVRAEILDPLCVAALNTPALDASAQVFLRVLQDALFSGPGASDLLIPRRPLAELLPEPAWRWLAAHGATLHTGRRVRTLEAATATATTGGWRVDGEVFDEVVLACPPAEAARLTRAIAPDWAAQAETFSFEPIVTGYVQAPGARLAAPMVALAEGPQAPAQFAFDHGALGLRAGRFAFVVSGAAPWVERGLDATGQALLTQARAVLRDLGRGDVRLERLVAEKRATFRCVPGLVRPPARIAPGLRAAADWIEGPYPATLEGAVRSAAAG